MSNTYRISVKCRSCRGDGFYEFWTDDDGQGHLDKCRMCYRGNIILKVNDSDIKDLRKQITELLGK